MEILYYIAKSETTHTQWQITDFTPATLQTLAEKGITFFAVHRDGRQEPVQWQDIHDPAENLEPAPLTVNIRDTKLESQVAAMSELVIQLTGTVEKLAPEDKAALQAAVTKLEEAIK